MTTMTISYDEQNAQISKVQDLLEELNSKVDEIISKEEEILNRIEHERTKKTIADIDEFFS